jgi:phosphoribosylanthranilate isomerase
MMQKAPLMVKICGLSTPETMEAALAAGADMVGLVFHPKSPRYVSVEQAAALANQARGRAQIVALVVDAEDGLLSTLLSTVKPDLWQFHGTETYERIRDAQSVFGLPVMKAVGVSSASDIPKIMGFARVAQHILLDAKPPADAAYPGGHGKVFDWQVLEPLDPAIPFMLSGGLTPDNVGVAVATIRKMGLNLIGVDVSSGVESAPGVKDMDKIVAFIAAARHEATRQESVRNAK